MAANAVMAARDETGVLKTRILSALVMAPPALLAAWMGGYVFAALAASCAAVMCWEWHRMLSGGFTASAKVAAIGSALAVLVAVAQPGTAFLVLLASLGGSLVLARPSESWSRAWIGFGCLYTGLPAMALVWLRQDPAQGAVTLWWLLLLVWATDIGAYAAGRLIGGPLLAPRVSPKKTWAGLLGGMVCAALVGLGVCAFYSLSSGGLVAIMSAAGAVVAQMGDLFESGVKRRAGVKDSSNIIPGHGGVLDRMDGLLAAGLLAGAATLASGQSPLAW